MKLRSRRTPQLPVYFGCAVVEGCAGCVELDGVVGFTGGGAADPAGDVVPGAVAGFAPLAPGVLGGKLFSPAPLGPGPVPGDPAGAFGAGCVSLCAISSTSKTSAARGGIGDRPFSPYAS